MKKIYTIGILLLVSFLLCLHSNSYAQCVDGSTPTPVMMDTTIYFEPGVTSTAVKFPQFDPEKGMLRCVRLTTTMTGVIDTVVMQNMSNTSQWATFNYVRNDQMQGPGLASPLKNDFSKRYGPYNVDRFDGNTTSGTDYAAIPRDTVLKKTVSRTLTDSTEIAQFYGRDSVAFDYNITVSTLASISGGSGFNMVLTSAMVNFKFEYCTCAKVALPLGLKNFNASKTSAQTANLYWEAENDNYNYAYDVEVSRDGKNFSRVATVDRKYTANASYLYPFSVKEGEYGRYFFRVRQRWQNGDVRYTAVKTVDFSNSFFDNLSLYPNPSNGAVGLKFVNARSGKLMVQISNASGVVVSSKLIAVTQTGFQPLTSLPSGIYWVKLTDLATNASSTLKLLVQ